MEHVQEHTNKLCASGDFIRMDCVCGWHQDFAEGTTLYQMDLAWANHVVWADKQYKAERAGQWQI